MAPQVLPVVLTVSPPSPPPPPPPPPLLTHVTVRTSAYGGAVWTPCPPPPSKGEHVRTPASTNRRTLSAFIRPPPPLFRGFKLWSRTRYRPRGNSIRSGTWGGGGGRLGHVGALGLDHPQSFSRPITALKTAKASPAEPQRGADLGKSGIPPPDLRHRGPMKKAKVDWALGSN